MSAQEKKTVETRIMVNGNVTTLKGVFPKNVSDKTAIYKLKQRNSYQPCSGSLGTYNEDIGDIKAQVEKHGSIGMEDV